jgi:hypothetical protein
VNGEEKRKPPSTVVVEGEPPVKESRLFTISLFGARPDLSREQLFLGKRGVHTGYVHTIGNTRVISYYEEDKVTA